MREIKFRGKEKDNSRWMYGLRDNYFWNNINLETLGQFTGLKDKNEKEIFEGDIIKDNNGIGVLMWFQTAWGIASYAYGYSGLNSYTAVDSFYTNEVKEWEVIGNIHDNPKLLTKNK